MDGAEVLTSVYRTDLPGAPNRLAWCTERTCVVLPTDLRVRWHHMLPNTTFDEQRLEPAGEFGAGPARVVFRYLGQALAAGADETHCLGTRPWTAWSSRLRGRGRVFPAGCSSLRHNEIGVPRSRRVGLTGMRISPQLQWWQNELRWTLSERTVTGNVPQISVSPSQLEIVSSMEQTGMFIRVAWLMSELSCLASAVVVKARAHRRTRRHCLRHRCRPRHRKLRSGVSTIVEAWALANVLEHELECLDHGSRLALHWVNVSISCQTPLVTCPLCNGDTQLAKAAKQHSAALWLARLSRTQSARLVQPASPVHQNPANLSFLAGPARWHPPACGRCRVLSCARPAQQAPHRPGASRRGVCLHTPLGKALSPTGRTPETDVSR